MNLDLIVSGGTAVLPAGAVLADIGIKNGRIAAICAPGSLTALQHMNAAGMLVLPGAIDIHVHFREPGATEKEDFLHGTAAAACGGVTAICDMPNTRPPVIGPAVLEEKLAIVKGSAYVDFGFWAGGVETASFPRFRELGAVGLKVYMNRAPPGSHSYSDKLSMPDDATFVRVLRAAAEIDWPVSVHVASPSIDEAVRAEMISEGRTQAQDVCLMTRSPESAEAQDRIIHYAQITGARLHKAHISYNSILALEGLRRARQRGAKVTAEVVPPCLTFADLDRIGAFGTPFAHSEAENERYWGALAEGLIDAVATDHAPHTRADKLRGSTDAWLAATGYPAVETMLPLLVDAALRSKLTFERLAAVIAENPARICSMTTKGAISIGRDADLTIVDPAARWTVDESKLHSKAGWSPFHGRALRGRIRHTVVRGVEVARDGELISAPPRGHLIPIADRASYSGRPPSAALAACPVQRSNPDAALVTQNSCV